jgi:hypothetical protein
MEVDNVPYGQTAFMRALEELAVGRGSIQKRLASAVVPHLLDLQCDELPHSDDAERTRMTELFGEDWRDFGEEFASIRSIATGAGRCQNTGEVRTRLLGMGGAQASELARRIVMASQRLCMYNPPRQMISMKEARRRILALWHALPDAERTLDRIPSFCDALRADDAAVMDFRCRDDVWLVVTRWLMEDLH